MRIKFLSVQYLLSFPATDAAPQQLWHTYKGPGKYVINITAYNLHSDKKFGFNKFVHNMTRTVFIQKPAENWELKLGDPPKWLDVNGGKLKIGNV